MKRNLQLGLIFSFRITRSTRLKSHYTTILDITTIMCSGNSRILDYLEIVTKPRCVVVPRLPGTKANSGPASVFGYPVSLIYLRARVAQCFVPVGKPRCE